MPRDLAAFRDAVSAMVVAPVTWKLVETWNEWGEGTAVEPGDQVIQTRNGSARIDPTGLPFKDQYIRMLQELLPPLEQGTRTPRIDGKMTNRAMVDCVLTYPRADERE